MKRILITFGLILIFWGINLNLIPKEWGFYFGVFCGACIWGFVSLIFDYINEIE